MSLDQMDSQTIRLMLAIIGVLVIAAVYLWGRYKNKMVDYMDEQDALDEADAGEGQEEPPPFEDVSKPAKLGFYSSKMAQPPADPPKPFALDDEDDEDDLDPVLTAPKPRPASARLVAEAGRKEPPKTDPLGAPFLIQISVVSPEGCFNGAQLRDALDDLRLIYGDMGIYHRYDREYRVPLFSIASLVEPGTFPIKDMDNFECPGVVLFFQPPQVDDPQAVFDDLVSTCHELSMRLGGIEWDEKRQPLTLEKINLMRSRLREAY